MATADDGGYLRHSCWTYWGHSGAPLFDAAGRVCGLHCAWDDRTGMRHGQKLPHLLGAMRAAAGPASVAAPSLPAKKEAKAKATKARRRK